MPRELDAGYLNDDESLTDKIFQLTERFPTYAYRRLWVILRFKEGIRINRKKVYRILNEKYWLVTQQTATPRPRVKTSATRHEKSNSS